VPEYPYRFVTQTRIVAERQLTPSYIVGGEELPDAGDLVTMQLDGQPFVVVGLDRRWGPADQFKLAAIVEPPPLDS
jgi:hypothetical protein